MASQVCVYRAVALFVLSMVCVTHRQLAWARPVMATVPMLHNATMRAELWPLPLSVAYEGATTLALPSTSSAFTFQQLGTAQTTVLQGAFERYMAILYPPATAPVRQVVSRHAGGAQEGVATRTVGSTITGVDVEVASPDIPLAFGVNESYRLVVGWVGERQGDPKSSVCSCACLSLLPTASVLVKAPRPLIVADTVWGAMHALETFSQLVQRVVGGDGDGSLQIWDTPITIHDAPRFPHRGLMLDTSRHFLPISLIQHAIDALSFNK